MSNQTHTDRVKHAGHKRREYLAKKTGAGLGGMAVAGLAVGFGGVALALIVVAVQNIGLSRDNVVLFGLLALAPLFVAVYLGHVSASSFQKVRSLAYVPSVPEQIAALPADEILLRSSDQPAAIPEELLRAAQAGTVEPAEELLRAESRRP